MPAGAVAAGLVAALVVLGAAGVRVLVRFVGGRGGMSWAGNGPPDDEMVEF